MGDMGDSFRAMKEDRRQERAQSLALRKATFADAQRLADLHDMDLVSCWPNRCQLKTYHEDGQTRWLYDLYPTTGRIITRPPYRGPFLTVPRDWDFRDVVSAAVQACEQEASCESGK